jgi:murein DD-endopeptidase MepM/ murein hydrolase activator NlpD
MSEEQSEKNTFKPFTFPFNKIIGVTQWYGFTDYQSPHTGIDFGATKEKVVSVGNGQVVGKGWDSYYGECLSGGNFLKVKHPNGIHTTYFHLEDMYVNTGDLVKQGQIIAKSGNTGAWNCQPLAYHMHFETRLNSSYNSHTNPVPYINVDWNKVPTLGTKYNPGRLSGENPHPGR